MKKLSLCIGLVGCCYCLSAQNVGIGTNTPTAKLNVSGTVRFQNIGEAAGNVLISDALGNANWKPLSRQEIYTVSSAAFQPELSSNTLVRTSGQGGVTYFPSAANSTFIIAPVNLPQGAQVTEVTFYFLDNSPQDLSLLFQAEDLTSGFFPSPFVSVTTSGSAAGWQSLTLTPANPVIIDNTNNSYFVKAYGNWPGNFTLAIKGVRIKYNYVVNN